MSAGEPTVSVVVTAYNYAHYIDACLDSVLAQTRAPDQILVVDDGSTDDTPQVLARYGTPVEVLRTKNGGQAAAFNRGFAASRGDAVLFLDADDLLWPEAVETLVHHWAPDLACLTFGLETIDEAGQSLGLHSASIEADAGDNRPRLLRQGTFRFPPTSGNLFSRWALDRALPMPEARWRISADCFLIRAAALLGRFGAVRQPLGAYRLHGANNYARAAPGSDDRGLHLANLADIAHALDDLAAAAPRLTEGPDEAAPLAGALSARASAIRAEVAAASDNVAHRPATPTTAGLALAAQRRAAAEPATEVECAHPLLDPRVPPRFAFDRRLDFRTPGAHCDALVPDAEPGAWRLCFRVPPSPVALTLSLGFDAAAHQGGGPDCILTADGAAVSRGQLAGQTVAFSLKRDPWAVDRRVVIEARAIWPGFGPRPTPPLPVHLTLSAGTPGQDWPLVPPGQTVAAGPALDRGLDPVIWQQDTDGGITLTKPRGAIGLSLGAPGPATLRLGLGGSPAAGFLTVHDAAGPRFTGRTGQASWIDIPLSTPSAGRYTIHLDFDPDGDAGLRLETLRLQPGWPGRRAALSVGEDLTLAGAPRTPDLLDGGWLYSGTDAPQNLAAEAGLRLFVPEAAEELSLTLVLAPLVTGADGARHILGISRDGAMIAAAVLEGPGEIAVPLGPAPEGGEIRLTLHSAFEAATEGDPRIAPLELLAIRLTGRLAEGPRPAPAPHLPKPRFHRLLATADEILANDPPDRARLSDLRRALAEMVAASNAALAVQAAAALDTLSRIGRMSSAVPPAHADHAALAGPEGDDSPDGRLRRWLLGVLYRPAHAHADAADMARIPAPLLAEPGALVRYLTALPTLRDAEDHRRFRAYLDRLLPQIETRLRLGPDDPLHGLAVDTLEALRTTPAIFGAAPVRDLVARLARCIEVHLTQTGARLATPRRARPGAARLRLGVFVRDVAPTPEGWALIGMYAGLDRGRFDLVLIRMEAEGSLNVGDLFDHTLCLSGLSLPGAVEAIRALDLDLFVTGAYAMGWERAAAILAHRLAPLQLWHGAVCPTTGGFRSFDAVLTCRATEPDAPERHYTEPIVWIDGPLQCAYAFDAAAPAPRGRTRADLGVPGDAAMLVSGAMAHKIGDDLITAWAAILKAAPGAILVLYPFAPNWSLPFAEADFIDRLRGAGLPADRVIVLPTQTPDRVRDILAAADLALDSFPYTGATTVCEALSVGTPVVTCAGDALRQLTGASWVRAYGLDDLVADSPADYVAIATRLAADPGALATARGRVEARLSAGPPPHNDPAAFGAAYGAALWRAAGDSGLFPDLGTPPASAPATAQPLPALRRTPPTRLAILASPRTGSTLLCAVLNRTPGVLCHFELFHEEMIQYRDSTTEATADLAARNADPVRFLSTLYADGAAAGYGVIGFKHFGHLSAAITRAVIADPAIRILVLGRENLLAQYSSETIAKSSGQWVSHTGEALDHAQITFDQGDFERFERYQARVMKERQDLLSQAVREALFLDFTMIQVPETRERLSRFLGLSVPADATPDIQRQNRPVILDRFSNPDAVMDYLTKRKRIRWAEGG